MKESITKQKVVAYLRVTTREQAELGYSLEAQRGSIRDYAEKNNLEIIEEFSDVGSMLKTNRKGFQEMLEYLKSSNDCKAVLVTSPEKLGSCEALAAIKDYSFISVKYGANKMENQLYFMLEAQRPTIMSERMKIVWQKRKAQAALKQGEYINEN